MFHLSEYDIGIELDFMNFLGTAKSPKIMGFLIFLTMKKPSPIFKAANTTTMAKESGTLPIVFGFNCLIDAIGMLMDLSIVWITLKHRLSKPRFVNN